MKKVVIFALFCLPMLLFAQIEEKISSESLTNLKKQELELQALFAGVIEAPYDSAKAQEAYNLGGDKAMRALADMNDSTRIANSKKFVSSFVGALKTPNSFHYPFDSLKNISILSPEDNSFRIFTWMVPLVVSSTYRYYGAIQMNSEELKLIGLKDKAGPAEGKSLPPSDWFGAVYYNIKQVSHDSKDYYMLFGWVGNNKRSDMKVLEVLHFEEEEPVFGAPIIEVVRDGEEAKVKYRFIMEFQDKTVVNMNYNEQEGKIIYDHLEPKDEKSRGSYFDYVPDGTYEGLQFVDGIWKFIPKVYHEVLATAPVPKPVLNTNRGGKKKKKSKKKKKQKKIKKKK